MLLINFMSQSTLRHWLKSALNPSNIEFQIPMFYVVIFQSNLRFPLFDKRSILDRSHNNESLNVIINHQICSRIPNHTSVDLLSHKILKEG